MSILCSNNNRSALGQKLPKGREDSVVRGMPHIYKRVNKVNGKSYIGQTNGGWKWYKGGGTYLLKAIKKYGEENFTWDVLICCEQEELDKYEEFFIAYHKTLLKEGGYNATPKAHGGNNAFADKTPEEMAEIVDKRQKSRSWYKGDAITAETRQKLSDAAKGRNMGEENTSYKGTSTEELLNTIIQTGTLLDTSRIIGLSRPTIRDRLKRRGITLEWNGYPNAKHTRIIGAYKDGVKIR